MIVAARTPHLVAEQVEAAEEQILEQVKRIDFYTTDYSVELLANKMHNGDFYVPDYQREFTWDERRRSRFIESIIMGLPIPFLFFWERPEDGKLEIVDGSQRLRTIEQFILSDWRLDSLESLTHLSGFAFADLLQSRQRKILNRPIRGIILSETADEEARLDMFDRINTSGKPANMAEIRRGVLAGPFLDLVIDLAEHPLFIQLAPVPTKRLREREREELVTRFFAYSDGLDNYKDRPSQFIFEYAKRMNRVFRGDASLSNDYNRRFIETMTFVDQHFPYGFRKSPTGTATPRARFEAIALGAHLAIADRPSLMHTSNIDVHRWLDGVEFAKLIRSDGANAINHLRDRMFFVRDRLLEQ